MTNTVFDIMNAFSVEPPPQDFVLPGFLAGTSGSLIAPGSTGKSMLALQIACAIACGTIEGNTTGLRIDKYGPVLYLNLEDPPVEVQRRFFNLGSRFNEETRLGIAKNLRMRVRQGIPTDLMDDKLMDEVLKDAEGCRLVVIDTLSRCHSLDENDNGAMSRLVVRLEMIARHSGAAVLFLHHTSKSAAMNGQGNLAQASRGAAALVDNGRWCGNLMKMTPDEAKILKDPKRLGFYVKYEVSKQNYGQVEVPVWYERTQGGILQQVNLATSPASKNSRRRDDI